MASKTTETTGKPARTRSTKLGFDALLHKFISSQRTTMNYARKLSEMALQHFHDHGDVTYLTRLYAAFEKNFMRRSALVKWACAHAPLRFEKSEFSKNKDSGAVELNLKAAFETPFWDFAPEQEITRYTVTAAYQRLANTYKTLTGEKSELDDGAKLLMDRFDSFLRANDPAAGSNVVN
jgi:hypothetical protein